MRKLSLVLILASSVLVLRASTAPPAVLQFVFTSDSHFGLTRKVFRGRANVGAALVNEALVATINTLPSAMLPKDGGIGGGAPVGPVDFVANGGDIANREETTNAGQIQPASVSWSEFERVYVQGVHLRDHAGAAAPVYVVPGNHDVSNAIGFHRPMSPATDASSLIGIYNLMMRPAVALTPAAFSYPRDRVQTSRDIGGIHFVFLTVWPDSSERSWMDRDLASVPPSTPVMVITHDQPEAEAKHFTNPVGRHDINAADKFENLLVDGLEDGPTIDAPPVREQSAFESFLAAHLNVTAYFHGNSNWNQFYDWTGPDQSVVLHAFRVDSPMKGDFSASDEARLSFQLATIDMASRRMTVREVLWNAHKGASGTEIIWGASTTVALSPRPPAPARRPARN
jgi:hypothetical protein